MRKLIQFSGGPSRAVHNPLMASTASDSLFSHYAVGRNSRNIHPAIKYLTLPLATADYDERSMPDSVGFFMAVYSFISHSPCLFQQCSAKQNFSNQHPNEVFSRNSNNNV